jgi:hypothetical protein
LLIVVAYLCAKITKLYKIRRNLAVFWGLIIATYS